MMVFINGEPLFASFKDCSICWMQGSLPAISKKKRHLSFFTLYNCVFAAPQHLLALFISPPLPFLPLHLQTCLLFPLVHLLLHTPPVPIPYFPPNHRLPEDLRPSLVIHPPMRHTQRGTSHIHTFESTSRFGTDTHKHQSLCLIPLSPITIPFPDVPRPMRESPPIPPPKIIK